MSVMVILSVITYSDILNSKLRFQEQMKILQLMTEQKIIFDNMPDGVIIHKIVKDGKKQLRTLNSVESSGNNQVDQS